MGSRPPRSGPGRTVAFGYLAQCRCRLQPLSQNGFPLISLRSRKPAKIGLAFLLAALALPEAMAGPPPSLPHEAVAEEQVVKRTRSLEERVSAIHGRLTEVRRRLEALSSGEQPPPEATAIEWAEYGRILKWLEQVYQAHLNALEKLREARRSQGDMEQPAAWSSPPGTGVGPAERVDELWRQVWNKQREIMALRFEERMFQNLREDLRVEFGHSEQALRKADELLRSAALAHLARARWLRDLSDWRNRQNEAKVALFDTEWESRAELLDYCKRALAPLRGRALEAAQSAPWSSADRDARLRELDQRQQGLEAETQQAAETDRQIQASLLKLRAPSSLSGDAAQPGQKADDREFETLRAEAEASGTALKVLRLRGFALLMERELWERRFDADRQPGLQDMEATLAEIQDGLVRLEDWRDYLASNLELTQQRGEGLERRLVDHAEAEDRDRAGRERAAFRRLKEVLEQALVATNAMDDTLHAWQEMLRLRLESAGPAERIAGLWANLRDLAHGVWDYEFLVVEDKIVAEGREIVGQRGVTLGKAIQVLLILGIGLWLNGQASGHGMRFLMRRLPGRESAVLLAVRLFGMAVVVGLVVFTLLVANIPLTAFAFLGGALAIGVGFGAQNLINNFISGLILLIERPIKLGDIVDIEGVRGRVAQIGSRCCEVRRFDGIDMLIPNSSFLEKNVTNWTLSDQHLRCTVNVGIAYGSPLREAAALLERAAAEHPLVLAEPQPEAYFEDFGDNALLLRLDFWVDINVEPNWRRVMSDIRYRLAESFDAHGIVVAFPQRDVHLDSARPVKVELVAAQVGGSTP